MKLLARELTCELCGNVFTCKRGIGCWCSTVELPREKLSRIRLEADDCVCASCLGR